MKSMHAGTSSHLLMLLIISGFLPFPIAAAPPASRPSRPQLDRFPEPPQPGDAAIHAWLAQQAAALEAQFDDQLPDPATWETQRPRWRQQFLAMLGLWPLPERTPLQTTVTGSLERDGYTIEKLHFQSRPRLYVTANLYRPTNIPAGAKLPAVLYVCGHGYRGPEGVKAGYQSHGIWLAKHGYVALLIDTLERGEIRGSHRGLYSEGRRDWLSRGYTPAGVECWNGMRAIDYLLTRPEVDPERIGVTGISGGGAYTIWIAATDERVRVAVPVSGMADLPAYVADRKTDVHCDCMFVPNRFEWPWTRIAALIAPRPMLFVNSDDDLYFPMDANERISNRLERFYGRLGAGDRFDTLVSTGTHAYRQDIRQGVFRFLNTYLRNDPSPVRDSEEDLVIDRDDRSTFPIAPSLLRVFDAGAVPTDAINARIDEHFVPISRPEPPAPGRFAAWRADSLERLKAESLRELDRPPAPARPLGDPAAGRFVCEGQIEFRLYPLADSERTGSRTLLHVSLADDARTAEPPDWLTRMIEPGDLLYLCQPRGVGEARWARRSPPNRIERACALVGTTIDAGRLRDIASAAAYLHAQHPGRELVVAGEGAAGLLAAYTALLEPHVRRVVLVHPPGSHADPAAPQFLGILRTCDVADVLGLLAPTRLTLIAAPGDLSQQVRACYAAAGSDRLDILAAP